MGCNASKSLPKDENEKEKKKQNNNLVDYPITVKKRRKRLSHEINNAITIIPELIDLIACYATEPHLAFIQYYYPDLAGKYSISNDIRDANNRGILIKIQTRSSKEY